MVNVSVFDVPPPEALNTVTLAVPAVAMSAALMLAVNWVLDPYVVVRSDPFQRTVDAPLTKPVPFTVRIKADPPAVADAGLKLVMVGTGLLIGNVSMFDVPPPGALLNTVTFAVPTVAMSAALILAVNRVLDTNVVVRADPFQRTVDTPLRRPVPFTVRVKADPPTVADAGLKLLMFGTGLLIRKNTKFESPPPGVLLNTSTFAEHAVARSAALILAVNWMGDTYVVVRANPFQRTVDVPTKPVPFTVRVKAGDPAVRNAGTKLVMVGMGLTMGYDTTFETPPPGGLLYT